MKGDSHFYVLYVFILIFQFRFWRGFGWGSELLAVIDGAARRLAAVCPPPPPSSIDVPLEGASKREVSVVDY